jgi:hypothetical protein
MKNIARSRGLSRVAEVRQAEGPSSHSPPRGPKNLGKPWEKHGESGCMWLLCVFVHQRCEICPYISKIYVKYVCVYGEYMEIWQEVEVELHSHIGCGDDGDVWVKSGHFIQW